MKVSFDISYGISAIVHAESIAGSDAEMWIRWTSLGTVDPNSANRRGWVGSKLFDWQWTPHLRVKTIGCLGRLRSVLCTESAHARPNFHNPDRRFVGDVGRHASPFRRRSAVLSPSSLHFPLLRPFQNPNPNPNNASSLPFPTLIFHCPFPALASLGRRRLTRVPSTDHYPPLSLLLPALPDRALSPCRVGGCPEGMALQHRRRQLPLPRRSQTRLPAIPPG